jgi:hypothetical protein
VILDGIGKQSPDELSFISSKYASDYVVDLSNVEMAKNNLPKMNRTSQQTNYE